MIQLDMRTIIFSYVLTDIVCLLVIILLWRQTRKRFEGPIFWVLDFAFQLLALILIILRGAIPDWMSMVLADTLAVTGALLGYIGLTRFVGKKSPQIHNYIFLAVFILIHVYFTFVLPDQAARNLNTSLGLLVMCFQCAWLLLYRVESPMRPLTRTVGVVFSIYCLISIIRIVEYFLVAHSKSDYLQAGAFEQMVLLAYQILFVFLTYALALMFNKRLLQDISTQEEKFSKAFHSSPYAVVLTRLPDGRIIEANDGFMKMTGYSYADISGKTTFDLSLWVREEDRAAVIDELSSKGKVHEREYQFHKKSGEKITALLSCEVITINNDHCVLSSLNDITNRLRIEEELRETSDYLNSLIDYANAPIITWDTRRIITRFNRAFEQLTGYAASEMVDRDLQILFPEESRNESLGKIAQASSGEFLESVEIPIQRKDGGSRLALWNSANIFDSEGKMIATIAQGQDITERKRGEAEIFRLNMELGNRVEERTRALRDSQLALLNLVDDLNASAKSLASVNDALEAVNKELSAFSYSVSHDLRAPLRSIDGFSQALLEDYGDKIDDTGRNYLGRIRRATQHMGQLIDDMLKLSRVTRAEFNLESVDLSAMVQAIVRRANESRPDRNIQVRIQNGLNVTADRNLLSIALVNLLDNALKFTSKNVQGEIVFGCVEKQGQVEYYIRDNGAGFDMAYSDKLFGTFQRLHSTEEFEGTGIGLATVKRIITRHGGTIRAEGAVGKGATFYFTLGARNSV